MTNKQILCRLRAEYLAFLLLAAVLVLLHETGVFNKGFLVGNASAVYVTECVGILLTIALIPVALKSFHKALLRMAEVKDERLRRRSYVKWNEIRLAMFVVVVVLNTSIYYATSDNMCGYCALMGLVASFFCWPTKNGVEAELSMSADSLCTTDTAKSEVETCSDNEKDGKADASQAE